MDLVADNIDCYGRPMKCAHFMHFKLKYMHLERPLPGIVFLWVHCLDQHPMSVGMTFFMNINVSPEMFTNVNFFIVEIKFHPLIPDDYKMCPFS